MKGICSNCNKVNDINITIDGSWACDCGHRHFISNNHDQSIKKDAGKIQYGLIPPECVKELAKVYMYGMEKYGKKDSWKQVEPERYKEALLRHVYEYLQGESINEEDGGVRVLAQIAWNAFTLLWMELHAETVESEINEQLRGD